MSKKFAKQRSTKSCGTVSVQHKSAQWNVRKAGGGVVNFCLHGSSGKTLASNFAAPKLIEVLRAGLPVQELEDLRACLDLSMEKLIPMLGISKATLHRRKAGGKL